jgi:hypothetical protein
MFLVPTFYEIIKNDLYILKMVKNNPINFFVIENGQFRHRMLISGPPFLASIKKELTL